MSSIIPKNDTTIKPKANRRRRKKRRTEDFSDSSDSSSSSSSSESENEDSEEKSNEIGNEIDEDGDVAVLSDNEIHMDHNQESNDSSFSNVKNKLKTVELTRTPLNESHNNKNINLHQVESLINQGNKKLENEYLGLMFENYGDDIDHIRKAPDFNERSLTILANVLKNGGNIFDEETLKAVVGK